MASSRQDRRISALNIHRKHLFMLFFFVIIFRHILFWTYFGTFLCVCGDSVFTILFKYVPGQTSGAFQKQVDL